MSKAVIYCRVSTKEQVANMSLATQEKACREYCGLHQLKVARVFVDEGESAKTSDRPELNNLLDYCRENRGDIDCLVVYALSRFSRQALDHHVLRAMLAKFGVTIKSVTEPIDDTSTGKLMENVLAAMAQFDNDVRSDRTKAGMRAAMEEGRWTFAPPIGYCKSINRKEGPSLIVDPATGPLVRTAFEMMAKGTFTGSEVRARVTALGLLTKRGNPISSQTFSAMLKKPVYTGRIEVPSLGLASVGDFEPIVNQELFDRVQAVVSGKRPTIRTPLRNHPDFPLRALVRCGACGRPLTGSRSKGRSSFYAYYHCYNRACGGVRVAKSDLEDQFCDLLESLQPRKEYVRLFRTLVSDTWHLRLAEVEGHKKSLEKRLQSLENRKDKLIEAHIYDRVISREDFQRQSDRLTQDIALVRLELNEATVEQYDVEAVLGFAEEMLLNARRLWLEFDLDQRQRFQQLIFPEGLEFDGVKFRTAPTCSIFTYLRQLDEAEGSLASPTGFEPVPPP